jgi:hypothetical protein
MAKTPTRNPITVRGIELLSLIAATGDVGLMLTKDEGQEAVDAGDAAVDTTVVAGDTAKVTLTDQGKAKVAAQTPAEVAKPSFTLRDSIEPPTIKRGGGRKTAESAYPFDAMEIGQSFHIPATATNPNPAEKIASTVSGQRVKYAVKTGETETITQKTYAKDAEGKFVKNAEGKRVVTGEITKTRDKMKLGRDFIVRSVGDDDPDGKGARVWRIAVKEGATV